MIEAKFKRNAVTVIKSSISPLSGFLGRLAQVKMGLLPVLPAVCLASLRLRVGAFGHRFSSPVARLRQRLLSLILICSPVF